MVCLCMGYTELVLDVNENAEDLAEGNCIVLMCMRNLCEVGFEPDPRSSDSEEMSPSLEKVNRYIDENDNIVLMDSGMLDCMVGMC